MFTTHTHTHNVLSQIAEGLKNYMHELALNSVGDTASWGAKDKDT